MAGFLRQINKALVNDAAHTVERTVNMPNLAETARFKRHADQRLVDDGGGATTLCDENFSSCHDLVLLGKGVEQKIASIHCAFERSHCLGSGYCSKRPYDSPDKDIPAHYPPPINLPC